MQQSPFLLFKTISYAGAVYLAYLGTSLKIKVELQKNSESGKQTSLYVSAREGLLISLLSPKIALFFIALFSQYVSAGNNLPAQSIIVLTPFLVDGLWYTLVTFLLSSARLIEKDPFSACLIDRLSGAVLILLAIRVCLQCKHCKYLICCIC